MNCLRCGKFIKKDETLLCETCYNEFWRYVEKNWRRLLARKESEDLIQLWLRELANDKKGND